jgi:hypothetical protein
VALFSSMPLGKRCTWTKIEKDCDITAIAPILVQASRHTKVSRSPQHIQPNLLP